MTKTLQDLYQEYPEHFASGAENMADVRCKTVMAKYPEFNERFPSGRKARQMDKTRTLSLVLAKLSGGRG